MNVSTTTTIATIRPRVPTELVHTFATASQVTMEMERLVWTQMNARETAIPVILTQPVKTQMDPSIAPAKVALRVMETPALVCNS